MKNLKTVTVGISAHNEQATIMKLLESIIAQKATNFRLKKIIVACDGCTDRTPELAKKFAVKHKLVEVVHDGQRLGKAGRLNSFYENLTTDIIVIFDADIALRNEYVISSLVSKFDNKNVGLVGGFSMPMDARNYFESIICTWLWIWDDVRIRINNGITIHNNLGCVTALSRELAKYVRIPNTQIPDDDFTFITAYMHNFKFKFAKEAVVYYRTVTNPKDFFAQHSRLIFSKNLVSQYFGDWVYDLYATPTGLRRKAMLRSFMLSPLKTILALTLQVILRYSIVVPKENYANGHWVVAASSKE